MAKTIVKKKSVPAMPVRRSLGAVAKPKAKSASRAVRAAKLPAKKATPATASGKSAKVAAKVPKATPGKTQRSQPVQASRGASTAVLGQGSDLYLLPFTALKKSFEFRSGAAGLTAIVAYEELLSVLKGILGSVVFDEEWYLGRYPDVALAVQKGKFPNARNHFVENGYFEGRFPFPVEVDEKWYLKENADVATAVREGIVESGAEHYYETGYLEGRKPRVF